MSVRPDLSVALSDADPLAASTTGLMRSAPEYSASRVLNRSQWVVLVLGLLVVAVLAVWSPRVTGDVLMGVATALYLAALCYRLALFRAGVRGRHLVHVSDEEALAVPDEELPTYTVLVPAYHEPLIGEVVAALDRLDYPRHKLDVRLLLEADDDQTVQAAQRLEPVDHVTIVQVPPAEPRTKPKACNYGLLDAWGDMVTIFDAEDRPDPLQLRRAVVALRRLGPSCACVQAELGYFNSTQNVLTRWFTLEYGTWFAFLLPGLVSLHSPVPLGGTSNHFRTGVLRQVGAWDPHNVTEDADLGIRLARLGYQVGVLDSVTLEEANSDGINWVKQRSRWYKGYLQTFLVHMRRPVSTVRELGVRGTLGLLLFVAGTPVLTALNAVFWALTLMWFVDHRGWVAALFPPLVNGAGLVCLVFGNLTILYLNLYTARLMNRPDLVWSALLAPFYWVLMSLAATKAAVQLVLTPSFWEKTAHGLTEVPATDEGPGSDAGPPPPTGTTAATAATRSATGHGAGELPTGAKPTTDGGAA